MFAQQSGGATAPRPPARYAHDYFGQEASGWCFVDLPATIETSILKVTQAAANIISGWYLLVQSRQWNHQCVKSVRCSRVFIVKCEQIHTLF